MADPTKVVVHPIVLLSAVDHFNRVAKDVRTKNKRVVGALLGERSADGTVDVVNSFALPFEEDEKNPDIFFLDHNFLVEMMAMFKKVSTKELLVGWYHTGPKIRDSDLKINQVFAEHVKNPVLVIIDVNPSEEGLPVESYYAVEEIKDDGTQSRRTFRHIASAVEAVEAEEVGVEHLLRDIKDTTVSHLSADVAGKLSALRGLKERLEEMHVYVNDVVAGRLPPNHDILAQVQDIFNLLPNLSEDELVQAFAVKTNDMMAAIYLASLMRSIVALHNLINNKIRNKSIEAEQYGEVTAASASEKESGGESKKGKGAEDDSGAGVGDS